MNCLFHLTSSSSAAAAIFSRTSSCYFSRVSFHCRSISLGTSSFGTFRCGGIRTTSNLEYVLARFRSQCYSSGKATAVVGKAKRSRKMDAKTVTEEEKNAFFVVRKGDVIGVFKSLNDCQAQVGTSICDPPVSVFKGYSMPKDAEEYLVSRGLKNALYTIKADDLKQDLFGTLVPWPFQVPETSMSDLLRKRSVEDASKSTAAVADPVRKQLKLDSSVGSQAPISNTRFCTLEFDGASKGNPGQAGAGAVIRADNGSVICRLREGLGTVTNNVAEYRAILLGLKYALQNGYTTIRVQGDSKLVCMQVQGLWKCKNENISDLCEEVKKLKDKFHSFQITHVLRGLNADADNEANFAVALDEGQVQVLDNEKMGVHSCSL